MSRGSACSRRRNAEAGHRPAQRGDQQGPRLPEVAQYLSARRSIPDEHAGGIRRAARRDYEKYGHLIKLTARAWTERRTARGRPIDNSTGEMQWRSRTRLCSRQRTQGQGGARHRRDAQHRALDRALARAARLHCVNARASREDGEKVVREIVAAAGRPRPSSPTSRTRCRERDGRGYNQALRTHRHPRAQRLDPQADAVHGDELRRVAASRISLDGSFHCAKACVPEMIKAGGEPSSRSADDGALGREEPRPRLGREARAGRHDPRARARPRQHNIRVNCVSPAR